MAAAGIDPQALLAAAFVNIGFSLDAAVLLTDPNRENITLETLAFLDDKAVKTLCASLRKPGGTILREGGEDGEEVRIPDPGTYISTRAELSMYVACYMARHFARTSRILTVADLTVENMNRFGNYRATEEAYKEPEERVKLAKVNKIMDFIDDWPESLALFNGQNGRPLSYVIRDEIVPPNANEDLMFGQVGSVYGNVRDEIEARAPHGTPEYLVDNALVYEYLNEAINEHKNVKTWIKGFAKTKDGRGAWEAFKAHFRGTNQVEAIEAAAEKQLDTLQYRGEKQNYNFEVHVSKHLRAHQDIAKATGQEMREQTKVRKLLKSIQVASLAAPIATVKSNAEMLANFNATVSYIRGFLLTNEHLETRNVSNLKTDGGDGKDHDGGKKNKQGKKKKNEKQKNKKGGKQEKEKKGEDRYYKPKEWWSFSQAKRDRIDSLREKRKLSAIEVDDEDHTSDNDESKKRKVSFAQTSQRK